MQRKYIASIKCHLHTYLKVTDIYWTENEGIDRVTDDEVEPEATTNLSRKDTKAQVEILFYGTPK